MEMNQAFTDLLGYRMDEHRILTPHPWWPTEAEDPEGFGLISKFFDDFRAGTQTEGDLVLFDLSRHKVFVRMRGLTVQDGDQGTTHLWIFHDARGEREAEPRRRAAAELSDDFAVLDDLGELIHAAKSGFGLFFDGECTVELAEGTGTSWFTSEELTSPELLAPEIRASLAGDLNSDTESLRPGILLLPPAASLVRSKAWVQFPRPRRITVAQMILADLLAAGFAAAIQRLLAAEETTQRVAHLELAMQSHRLVGQATGVLVERHRLTPVEAFEMLRTASQRRNVKLRELAALVIETGLDPGDA